jgi:hypothetical protein
MVNSGYISKNKDSYTYVIFLAIAAVNGVTEKRINSDKNVMPVRNRQSLNAVKRNLIIKET